MAKNRVVLTPEFRMSFPNLIKAKEFIEKGKPSGKFSYNVEMLFPEDSLAKFKVLRGDQLVDTNIEQLLVELAKETWGNEIDPATGQPITVKAMFAGVAAKGWPLRRGDVIADALKAKQKSGEHYRGVRVMAAKSNVTDKVQPPALSIAAKGGAQKINRLLEVDLDRARNAFVGGNYAVAELNIAASVVGGLKYLTAYLNLVRYTRDGAKLGGGGGALMDRFDGVSGGQADHDPTAGMGDDEIPF
jgi:hypothetical protein